MTTRTMDTELLRVVRNGGKSALKKSTLPVLTCVLVKASGASLEVVSTDLDTVSRDSCTSNGDEFQFAVPYKPLLDWLRAMEPKKKTPVILELEKVTPVNPYPDYGNYVWDKREYLKVKAGNITAKFYGIDAGEFPDLTPVLSVFDGIVDCEPIVKGA